MLNLIVNGARVSYDSLEEAKDAARDSGLGLAFWRETLIECAENEAMWNEFLNDLWQSGAEDEAERLDRTFPKDAPRHWLLVALTLGGDDPWEAFLTEWEAQGDERILSTVSSPAFAPWLKQVQPMKYDLLVRAFGADATKWPNDLLLKALKAEGTVAEIAEWKTVVEKRKEPKWLYHKENGEVSIESGKEDTPAIPKDWEGDLVLPSMLGGCPVTSIGKGAFAFCEGLRSVTIPSGVACIGESAFCGCKGLTLVSIPPGVTSIGEKAFRFCEGLTSVTIPPGVTSIGERAFEDCDRLAEVKIPASVTDIGKFAFSDCCGLQNFCVDSTNPVYRSIDGMLCSKDGKTLIVGVNGEVRIPSGVTHIGEHAFGAHGGLTSVTIPPSVTSIGKFAFFACRGLTTMTIPVGVTCIEGHAFFECSGLTSVTIPPSVTSIGKLAFCWCRGLTSVIIPSSVTSIGESAFSNCKGLTTVTIPSSVTSIGECAFSECIGLTTVYVERRDKERVKRMIRSFRVDVDSINFVER